MFRRFTAIFVLTAAATAAPAQVTSFDLMGVGGVGLLPTNELHTIFGTPGSGGEIGAGISYDAATNQLTINIGWGTGNGFLDLTGSAAAGHIHGFANQNATAGVQVGLDSLAGWNASATAGGFSGTVTLDDTQESQLLLGNMYINVHTATNGGGEMRGNLVPVPEPTLMLALAAGSLAGIRFVRGRFRPVVAMA